MRTILLLLLPLGTIVAGRELETEREIGRSKVAIGERRRPERAMGMKWRGTEEMEKVLEVAMCRARCLPLATTCWSNCELFPGRGSSRVGVNRPGRGRAGRRLKTRLAFPSQPLLVDDSEGRCSLTWSDLAPVPNSYTASPRLPRPNVFLLVGSESNSMDWKELGQTNGHSLPLPLLTADLSLILVAVGKRGIRTKATIKVKAGQCSQQRMETRPSRMGSRPSAPELLTATKVGSTLVKVELQWSGPEDASYVLRWQEEPNSPVTASLVTSETKASITLEENTVYSTLVEMTTSQGKVTISQPRTIDTKNLKYKKDEILQANPMISGIKEMMDEKENLFSKENLILFVILALFVFLVCLAALFTLLWSPFHGGSSVGSHTFDGSIGGSSEECPKLPKMPTMAHLWLGSIKEFLGFLFKRSVIQPPTNA